MITQRDAAKIISLLEHRIQIVEAENLRLEARRPPNGGKPSIGLLPMNNTIRKCPQGHTLAPSTVTGEMRFSCDGKCRKRNAISKRGGPPPELLSADTKVYSCRICNYDLCSDCAAEESLQRYLPRDDRSHQWLGISYEGMVRFLEAVGFVCWNAEDEPGGNEDRFSRFNCSSWSYTSSYSRPAKLAAWLDPIVGPLNADNLTGYDLCSFLRQWLKREGHEKLSVCEVILTHAPFSHLRCYIHRANVFWSHIQLEGVLGSGSTLSSIAYQRHAIQREERWKLPSEDEQFIWLDYFCLRQCQNDFAAEFVVPIVKGIGTVIACLSFDINARKMGPAFQNANYLQRSFCTLELYAAVAGGAHLVFIVDMGIKDIEQILAETPQVWEDGDGEDSDFEAAHDVFDLWLGPVDCEAATTRSKAHKTEIDRYIRNSVGFEEMNRLVKAAIFRSAWDSGNMVL